MNKQWVLSLLVFSSLIVLTSNVIAVDPYKPYLHNPIVPEHPKVQLQGTYETALWPGAGIYSYPLELPPGTNGLQPSLTIAFNSQTAGQRPGILGSGWSLTTNYIIRDVSYTFSNISDDTFKLVLDGQLYNLVYDSSDSLYHTEIDTFLKIQKISSGGNNTNGEYWKVTKKDGTVYRFGYHGYSELVSSIQPYTAKWSLDTITDTHGNNIFYTYAENPYSNDRSAVYLTKIEYNNDKSRTVEFIYEGVNRPDTWLAYENGIQLKEARRLTDIYVKTNNVLVRKYSLSYLNAYPASRSFISAITLYGSNNNSALSATSFTYQSPSPGWELDGSLALPDNALFENQSNGADLGVRLIDFNRDGLLDLVKSQGFSSGAWVNNGSAWVSDSSWQIPGNIVTTFGADVGFRIVDFNGDGFDDFIRGNGNFKEAYQNNMHGWTYNAAWLSPVSPIDGSISDTGMRFADVNGDGFQDILQATNAVNEAWINNKTGWTSASSWRVPGGAYFVSSSGEDQGVRIVDFNGDGLPDLIKAKGTNRTTWINNGSGWNIHTSLWQVPSGMEFVPASGSGDLGIRFADLNGDNLPDLVKATEDDHQTWMNNGYGWDRLGSWDFPAITTLISSYWGSNKQIRLVDVDGDGLVDILNGGLIYSKTYLNKDSKSYQLKTITNNLGGTQSLDFMPSTKLNNTGADAFSDLGFNIWVVRSLTENNGLSNVQGLVTTTYYSYLGGLYDYASREFRGFNRVDEIKPSSIVRHSFYQSNFLKGKEYQTSIYDKSSNLFSSSSLGWQSIVQNNHSSVLLSNETTYLYDGNYTAPRVTETAYAYDTYGNPISIMNKGDNSTQGDEYYEYYDYVQNTTAWIVDKPLRYRVFDFDNTTKLREMTYRYDNLSYGTVPTKGDLTWEEHWLSNSSTNSTLKYSYESYGNLIEQSDPNGNKSSYVYGLRDTTHTYADRFVNPKNHTFNYNYDLGTGDLLSEIDANGYLTNYSYDIFGRITKEIKPYDSATYATKEYNYSFDGVAPELIKVSQRESAGTSNTFDSHYFYDGFGNLVQIKTEANATARVEKDFFYDSEKRLVKEFNPYFVNISESYSNPDNDLTADSLYYYDPLSRATYALYAGGGTERVLFDHGRVTAYDKNGNKKVYYTDAYGRVAKTVEYVGNNYYTTSYKYAPTGEIVQINDSSGNIYTYQYDSLGRKTKEINPDLGTWNYQYDAAGNLINQIDNRSVNVSLNYDSLNRLISKNSSSQSIAYIYDRINGTLWKTITPDTTFEEGYDQRLRKINETMTVDGHNFTKKWGYDSFDRMTNETLPDNSIVPYTYTSKGDIKTVGSVIDNVIYNEFSKPTQLLYHNGLQTNMTYDSSTSRVRQIKTSNYQNINYGYDLVGNILSINDTANNITKLSSYDKLDRLSSSQIVQNQTSTSFNYTYDALGDILQSRGRSSLNYYYGTGPLHAPKKLVLPGVFSSISFISPTPADSSVQNSTSLSVRLLSSGITGAHYVVLDSDTGVGLWLRMDDRNATGSLVDLSAYANPTIMVGSPQNATGQFGTALAFNTTGAGVRIPSTSSIDAVGAFTISFWFRGNDSRYGQFFAGKWDGVTSNDISWQAALSTGGICNGIDFYVSQDGGSVNRVYTRKCNQNYQDGQWHHFVGVFNPGQELSLYVDGNASGTTTVGTVATLTSMHQNTEPLYIGNRTSGSYNGSLDEVVFFNRALSSSEVASLRNAQSTQYSATFTSLSGGAHYFKGYVVDALGGIANTGTRTIYINATSPSVQFIAPTPSDGSVVNATQFVVNLSSSDSSSHYSLVDFDRDMVLWMPFDDVNGAGNPLDASTYGNYGTKQGNAVQSSSGKFGKSFSFDGVGDGVIVSDQSSLDLNSSFSVSFWFKGNASTTQQPLVGKWNGTSGEIAWFADLATGGACDGIDFYVSEDGGSTDRVYVRECNKRYQDNQWHLFTGTFDAGNSIKMYIDGTSVGTVQGTISTVTGVYTNNEPLQIGTGYAPLQYNGSIDDALLFRRALSQQEVSALYNAASNQYSNTFSQVDDITHTLRGYAMNSYGARNSTSLRTVRVVLPLDVSGLSYVTINSTQHGIAFLVNNTLSVNITNIAWNVTTGAGTKYSQFNMTLEGGKSAWVIISQNYNSSGTYPITATAYSANYKDKESIIATV